MTSISFGLACIACILLSLSLKRHYRQVWPSSLTYPQWSLINRVSGYLFLFLALLPCILFRGLWIGLVLWTSVVALAAFLQAMLLTWWPQRSLLFGGAGLLLIVAGLII